MAKKTPAGCEWRTVMGRPVLIKTSTGEICGGSVPRSWHGKRLQDRPWETKEEKYEPPTPYNYGLTVSGKKPTKGYYIAKQFTGRSWIKTEVKVIPNCPQHKDIRDVCVEDQRNFSHYSLSEFRDYERKKD